MVAEELSRRARCRSRGIPDQTMIDRTTQANSIPARAAAPGWGARLRARVRSERGFTLIEAIVAGAVLVVGLLTAYAILVISDHASASVRAREAAVTLARQATEDARSIPYSQVSSSTIVTTLEGMPGLASSSSGSSWTISRSGTAYTLNATVTSVYDCKDPANDPSGTCANNTVDLKQIAVTVSWTTFQGAAHSVTETTTVSSAGQDAGLIASGLQLASPTAPGPYTTSTSTATAPVITSASATSLTFSVTAPSGTAAVVWTLDGGKESTWAGSTPSSGTTWTSSAWSISGVSDGTYTIGAQAEDSDGVDGPAVTMTVRLIRNVPSAPNVTGYGFNSSTTVGGPTSTVADLQWSANPELNVIGYKVTSPTGSTCSTSTTSFSATGCTNWWCFSPTACIDLNPPSVNASNLTYTIQALYDDTNNNLQAGTATNVTLASGAPNPPPAVPLVSLSVITEPDDTGILTWTPPTGGTAVSFYRIYRDGDAYSNRYDTLSASSCTTTCTYHDTNRSTSHSYYITAVSASMAESTPTGPVSG